MLVQWLNDRTILERILAINLAVILLMGALGLVTLHHFNRVIQIGKQIEEHPLVVSNAVLEIESNISDLNGYLKTALETGKPKAIAAYQSKMDTLDPAIQANFWMIEERFLGDQSMVHGATTNYLSWKHNNARIMDALSGIIHTDTIEQNSRESWLSRDLMGDYLTEINLISYTKARGFIEGLQGERQGAVVWTIVFVLIAASLATILSTFVGQTIARPIRALEKVMGELAKGNLDVILPTFSSRRFEAGAIALAAAALKAEAQDKVKWVAHTELARKKAESANQSKSRFLAMMSHELRTPMNAILGSAQVLDAMKLDPEVREHVDTLTIGGETLTAILNDVLDLSKIESGKLTVERTDFDIHALLDQAQSLWSSRAGDKALALNFHIDKSAPQWIRSDITRIRQILFNLLSNAIKFTPSGQIDVSIRKRGSVDGRAELEIAVRDTGIGMSKQALQKLFTPFEQADSTITRRFGGTGLGLSIAQQLAELLGGNLTVDSKKDEGSTFTFRFSAAICAAQKIKKTSGAHKSAATRKLSILVAEDNDMNMKVLRALLKPLPYDLIHAENGEIALSLLEDHSFDLVLMDIQMPVLDGLCATQQLRAGNGRNKNIPVIAMTANAMDEDRERYFAAGMTGYVPKPIDVRQLLGTIARAADQGHKDHSDQALQTKPGAA